MRTTNIALLVVLVAAGCARSEGPVQWKRGETILAVAPGEAFPVKLGETVRLGPEGPVIGFVDVPADDRCPADSACAWSGDAAVELSFRMDASRRKVELYTGREPRQASIGDYLVTLDDLQPARTVGSSTRPAEYVAVLRVTAR